MKKLTILVILSLFFFNFTYGQDQVKYAELVKEAWSLYENKDFLKSGQKYEEAFTALEGKGEVDDRYDAACAWSLANQKDAAFIQLTEIAENGNYKNIDQISTSTDLTALHNDARWNKIISLVKVNKEKAEANWDRPLVDILNAVYEDDTKTRHQTIAIHEKFGWVSDEMAAQLIIMQKTDSINLIKVKKILDERGWLAKDIVGDRGNLTLFLVIQHADQDTQEEYLPMVREAVKKGNAEASSLALLEDRVALGKGEKQIYGSQISLSQETGKYFVRPLIDPDHVDKRRASVGLEKLQEYISHWDITWDVEAFKKEMSKYDEQKKEYDNKKLHQ